MPPTRPDINPAPDRPTSSPGPLAGLKTAITTLLPVGPRPVADTATWQAAVWWIVPLGLLTGLIWAGVFRASWRAFGEVAGVCPIPALAVVLLDVTFLGYRQYRGAAQVLDIGRSERNTAAPADIQDRSIAALIVLVITVLTMWVLILALPKGPGYWPSGWRESWHLNELYPRPVFRPLILAPLWGHWAMLMAGNVGRARPGSSASGLCAAARPIVVLVTLLPVIGLTTIYCSRQGNRLLGLIVGLVVLAVTHVLSTIMGRRCRGQCFGSLFASAKVAEITFLLTYLALVARP